MENVAQCISFVTIVRFMLHYSDPVCQKSCNLIGYKQLDINITISIIYFYHDENSDEHNTYENLKDYIDLHFQRVGYQSDWMAIITCVLTIDNKHVNGTYNRTHMCYHNAMMRH